MHSGGVMDCLLCSYSAPSILPSHPSVQTRPAVHWRHKQQLQHGSAAEAPGRRWLVARGDWGRAVGTAELELASCWDPPLQSAGAHSAADKGFAKGAIKPRIAAKIIYPKLMSLLLMISPSPLCQRSSECPPFICWKSKYGAEAAHHKQLLSSTETACPHCPHKLETCTPYCSLNTFWFKHLPQTPSWCASLQTECFLCRVTAHGWKQSQITAAMGHSKALSHRASAGAALQFGASCGQPMLVGTVGKLEVNSLARHAPMGLQRGICSRHAQTAWHWWTPSVYLSSNSSLDKEHYRWWIGEESLSRGRAVHCKIELRSWLPNKPSIIFTMGQVFWG